MSPQLYFTQQREMLEVDLHILEWRQPYFCTVQKERDRHGTKECTNSKEKTRGKKKIRRERIYPVSKKEALVICICFMVICFINGFLNTPWSCLKTSFTQF